MDNGRIKVLEKNSTFLNPVTGEIQTQQQSVVLKTKRREKFMLLYVENFSMFVNLNKRTQEVLAMILAKKVTYGTNEVVLDSFFRRKLSEELQTSGQVITNSISELVKKQVLQRKKLGGSYQYHLNPFLFGQGEWNTIEKQRQEFTLNYDFVNYTANKEIKTVTQYEGLPDAKDIQVLSLDRYESDNIKVEQALIQKKNDEEIADVEVESSKNDIQNDQIKLEILKEQNRARELEIERIRAEKEKMNIENENIKLKMNQPSLF